MGQEERSRTTSRIGLTVLFALLFILLFSAFICGCCFHAISVIPNLFPVLWGFYALFTYRNRSERIVGWVAFVVGLVSVWIGFEANLKFALAGLL